MYLHSHKFPRFVWTKIHLVVVGDQVILLVFCFIPRMIYFVIVYSRENEAFHSKLIYAVIVVLLELLSLHLCTTIYLTLLNQIMMHVSKSSQKHLTLFNYAI
jgi:hypothetical protein